MKPPHSAKVGPLIKKLSKQGIANTAELAKQYDQLIVVSLDAEYEALQDRASLECLQKYGKLVKQWDEELAELHKKPVSQWPAASAASSPKVK